MKNIFIAYGHHNTTNSFNAAIRDTFITEVKKNGYNDELQDTYMREVLDEDKECDDDFDIDWEV